MIPKDEMKEMNETLSEVAKIKAEFELLKKVIISSLDLDYSGEGLTVRNDSLIVEVMKIIEPYKMDNTYENLKSIQMTNKAKETKHG